MFFEENIRNLGIDIPCKENKPLAAYEPYILIDNFMYISGQLPFVGSELKYKGIVGKEVSIENGYEAAKICTINALGIIKNAIGSLDKVKRIIQIQGFVNCMNDFSNQPQVINGASDLIIKIFGDSGKHTRFAIGNSGLPMGASVEIGMILKIKNI